MLHILYNPLANNKRGEEAARALQARYTSENPVYKNITEISDMQAYMDSLTGEDKLLLVGGDGTLNRFVNAIEDKDYPFPVLYYSAGSGNDFMNDLIGSQTTPDPVEINKYIKDLPEVTVNGATQKFINGIGYGIDGYCCEVGDAQKEKSDKPVNYAGIAIKGLLFHFKPKNATVIVDGQEFTYKKAWLAPTMNGKFYGGGMMIAPAQDRSSQEKTVSTVVLYGSGKLKTLIVFPSIFKGTHVDHKEMVAVHTGHEITVKFDAPCALQIDGETVLGVTEYTVKTK